MGFFFAESPSLVTTSRGTPTARQAILPIRVVGARAGAAGCANCSLNAEAPHLKHPRMEPTGSDDPLVYILGEAPGKSEDEQGAQFVGASGKLLRSSIPEDMLRHVRWNNQVRCRPPGNRTPTKAEIAACSQYQVEDIERTQPVLIIGFGAVPLDWATNQSGITDWRGQIMPVKVGKHKCWYAAMWHPAYVLRMRDDGGKLSEEIVETFKRDMRRVFNFITNNIAEPYIPEGEELSAGLDWELSWDLKAVENKLANLSQYSDQAIDIETKELRPYEKTSKILSIALGTWEHAYAIPIRHREAKWTDKQLKSLYAMLSDYLMNSGATFYAHHLKFELEWLSMPEYLGRDILFQVPWGDTMAQAEAIRTQSLQAKSLEARCVALFGVAQKSLDDAERLHLDNTPLVSVLRYNSRDVKFTDLLRQRQEEIIEKEGIQRAYTKLVERVPALVIAQQFGVLADSKFAEAEHERLQTQIDAIEAEIQALPDVKKMVKETGKPFNSSAPQQLVPLMRDRLKLKEGWIEEDGVRKYSTAEPILAKISHPIGPLILKKRGLEKLDGTYLAGLCRRGYKGVRDAGKHIHDDGLVHTNYNYLVASTGRLSSDSPNLQNIPVRTTEGKRIREAFVAPLGHKFTKCDYGQIEARVIAMASGCPVLHKALWEHYDVHMDWSKRLSEAFPYVLDKYQEQAEAEKKEPIKLFRTDIKNEWTFPLFYGSAASSCAAALGVPERDLLPHVNEFWDTFSAVKKWQRKVIAAYQKNGYVETLTGRRRYGPLGFNEAINSPIQGTASDIVIDSQQTLVLLAYEMDRWQIAPRLNMHDDLSFYLPTYSINEDLEIILETMLTPHFDFITVPLTVEFAIGDNWGSTKDVATVESTEYDFPTRRALQ